jgi:hypothetical protein
MLEDCAAITLFSEHLYSHINTECLMCMYNLVLYGIEIAYIIGVGNGLLPGCLKNQDLFHGRIMIQTCSGVFLMCIKGLFPYNKVTDLRLTAHPLVLILRMHGVMAIFCSWMWQCLLNIQEIRVQILPWRLATLA